MAKKSMGTSSLAKSCIKKGVNRGDSKVDTAVRVSDSAKFAPEI